MNEFWAWTLAGYCVVNTIGNVITSYRLRELEKKSK